MLRLHFTQGHKPQTKSGVRVHCRASQSGRRRAGGRAWEAADSADFTIGLVCLFVYFLRHQSSPTVNGCPQGSWWREVASHTKLDKKL